jgi:hypothetical protein
MILWALLFACTNKGIDDSAAQSTDEDWDGYSLASDCDDLNALVHPDASEVCDGIDNDCNGEVDDEPADIRAYFADADGDGAGDPTEGVNSCVQPSGYVLNDLDCDDTSADVRPGLAETCDDRDNDCDHAVDEEASDASYWYADLDADGFGNAQSGTVLQCDRPNDWSDSPEDCDDTNALVHPDATEFCDGAGADEDCDGLLDDDDDEVTGTTLFYLDEDEDGHGDPDKALEACREPPGYALLGDDCDDAETSVHPDAPEQCGDGLDNDCDKAIDEEGDDTPVGWFADDDGDGYGDPSAPWGGLSCADPGGKSVNDGDCDDSDPARFPGAKETWYDGVDQDCDAHSDYDADLDEFDAEPWGSDCNDLDDAAYLGAAEQCATGADEDCDGVVDDCSVLAWVYGDAGGDEAGISVAAPGDVTGDGTPDVLVGAQRHGTTGAVYLLEGPVDETSAAIGGSGQTLDGITTLDWTGCSVAGAGDVNGDGTSDFLVGALGVDDGGGDAGAAYLFYGPAKGATNVAAADLVVNGEAANDLAGWSVGGGGDYTDDGVVDLLVGAVGRATTGADGGAVYVVSGETTGTLDLVFSDARIFGTDGGDWAGHAVANAGDVDGDGIDDVLLGAPYADGAESYSGAAYLFEGPLAGSLVGSDANTIFLGSTTGDLAGFAVASAGDVDGDGRPDLLVGAPEDDTHGAASGVAGLFVDAPEGSLDLASADARIEGTAPGDNAGSALAGRGSFDGDGHADVVVAAPYDDSTESDAGGIYAFLGPLSGTRTFDDADAFAWGPAADARYGASVAVLDDSNGDGGDDLLVGVPSEDTTGTDAGAVHVLSFAGAP